MNYRELQKLNITSKGGKKLPTQQELQLKDIAFLLFLPTKHLRVHMNSFKCVRVFQIELEFGCVGF